MCILDTSWLKSLRKIYWLQKCYNISETLETRPFNWCLNWLENPSVLAYASIVKCLNLLKIRFNKLLTFQPVQPYLFNDTVLKIELGPYDVYRYTGIRLAKAFIALLLSSSCS